MSLHALDAEQSVLGGLMLVPTAIAKIDWLAESDFYSEQHRLIFRAIGEITAKGEQVDVIVLCEWFDRNGLADLIDGTDYLMELANNTPGASNIVAYAEIVLEKSRLRMALDAGHRLTKSATDKGAEASQVVAQAVHDLSQLQVARLRGGLQPTKPLLKRFLADFAKRYESGPKLLGLETPWLELNKLTKGLRDGTLYVVGARPSMGKSIFALQLAGHAALRGHATAMFSAEMTADECMGRLIACAGEIPHDWIEQPCEQDGSEIYWNRSTLITAELLKAPLLLDETPAIRIEQLMARARKAHLQSPLRLITVDHLHDMDHGSDAKNVRIEIGRAVQGLKTLAKELACPVVLMAQLNRNGAKAGSRPTLTDLRETGEIEQKADVVLFLHREDYYDKSTHFRGVVELIPAKGRNIRIDETIHLFNRYKCMRMDDWEGPLPHKTQVVELIPAGLANPRRARR